MDLKYLHQDEADEMEWGCIKLKRCLEDLEDDFNRMHCHSKELNDSLLEISSTDLQLREILLERENFMEKRLAMEKMFFSECRDMLSRRAKDVDELREGKDDEQTIE